MKGKKKRNRKIVFGELSDTDWSDKTRAQLEDAYLESLYQMVNKIYRD